MPETTEKYYVLDNANCRFESMTKEQIIAAIIQAVNQGTIGDIDTGFISKVLEINGNQTAEFWIGTAAQYAAIETKSPYVFYKITDDSSADDIQQQFTDINTEIDNLNKSIEENALAIEGKANSEHDHSASDITSGTLPVARGGTGVTTYTELASKIKSYIISEITGSGSISRTVADMTEYRFTNVSSLSITYPSGNFECWIRMTVRTSGSATVSFPTGTTYIGNIPSPFAAGKTYEISIKDKIAVIAEVG